MQLVRYLYVSFLLRNLK